MPAHSRWDLIRRLRVKSDQNNNGTLHEDQCTFVIIFRSVIYRMRNFSDKSRRENRNTHFVFSNCFPVNRAIYEIVWQNKVQPDRPQMTI